MLFVWLLCLLSVQISITQARHSSHWMVTETGLVQPKDESPFLMTKPFDLLSFLNQDTRWENILNIHNNLIRRQNKINKLWLKLEACTKFTKYIAENKDCARVGSITTMDWYTSFLEDGSYKGIKEKEYGLNRSDQYGDTDVPDCKKISSLTFSMSAFEHLDSMINRENLNATPEYILPLQFSPIMTVEQFGHWVSDTLRKNSSSWLHYNLAALYWRCKGNMPKAMECSRRAVHYAPRYSKDIALLCMGTILHRSQHTEDALIVLGAALDHDSDLSITHFSKAMALATIGDYNTSLTHFNLTLKLDPHCDIAQRFKHGVLCHIHLLKKIRIARKTVKELRMVLREYINLEKDWLRFQVTFLQTMKHEENIDYTDIEAISATMGEITGRKFRELKSDADCNIMALYIVESPTYNGFWEEQKGPNTLHTAQALQKVIQQLGHKTGLPTKTYLPVDETRNSTEILKEIGPMPLYSDVFPDLQIDKPLFTTKVRMESRFRGEESVETGQSRPDTAVVLYPPNFKVNRNRELFDTDPNWPSDDFCRKHYPDNPENIEFIYPVFMPFENKGIQLETLLTTKIGVPALVQHELPWHPPVCPTDKDLSLYTRRTGLKINMIPDIIGQKLLLRQILRLMYKGHYHILENMQYAEMGQRIQTAIKKKLADKWVLYTIASLYWRVRGNIPSALNCLLTANRIAERRYRDVVLVSLASVFMEMGLLDECSNHIEEAYKMSPYEPTTNFVLAQLSMIKKNQKAVMFHLKQAIRVDEYFMNGFARSLFYEWTCVIREAEIIQREAGDANEVCAGVEPGLSMVCERDGTNCHISKRDCQNPSHHEKSQIVRMLELKDDTIQGRAHVPEEIRKTLFDRFIEEFPQNRWDMEGHWMHYEELMDVMKWLMKWCKDNSVCWQKEPDDLKVIEADCSLQKSQMEYWLYHITFRLEIGDTVLRLPSHIAETPRSKKSLPDCQVPSGFEEEFFMKLMMRVDSKGWGPTDRLMQQLTDIYRPYGPKELGAKIARYVEMNPNSWTGLIAAGWWCGASGYGLCAVRCLAGAHALAPPDQRVLALRSLSGLLHMQSKYSDARKMAYLAFYEAPKDKLCAYFVGLLHTYSGEYNFAAWMYRYVITLDHDNVAAKRSLHVAICYIVYGDTSKKKK